MHTNLHKYIRNKMNIKYTHANTHTQTHTLQIRAPSAFAETTAKYKKFKRYSCGGRKRGGYFASRNAPEI